MLGQVRDDCDLLASFLKYTLHISGGIQNLHAGLGFSMEAHLQTSEQRIVTLIMNLMKEKLALTQGTGPQ